MLISTLLILYAYCMLTITQMYKDATVFFSQESVSTIAHVIPTIDQIDAMLLESFTEPLAPAVKHGLSFTHHVLNKYYLKTDASNIYRIAMILHPQMKLKYFQHHKWSQEWIDTAEAILQEEFLKYDKTSSVDEQEQVCSGKSWTADRILTHNSRLPHALMQMSTSLISRWMVSRNRTRLMFISHLLSKRSRIPWCGGGTTGKCTHTFLPWPSTTLAHRVSTITNCIGCHWSSCQPHQHLLSGYFPKAGTSWASHTTGYHLNLFDQCCALVIGAERISLWWPMLWQWFMRRGANARGLIKILMTMM